MRQLRLVWSNSKKNSGRKTLASVKCKMLRADLSSSPLVQKILRLEQEHTRGAAVIEKLVDDLLNAAGGWAILFMAVA